MSPVPKLLSESIELTQTLKHTHEMAHYKSNSDIGNSQSMRFSDFDPSGVSDMSDPLRNPLVACEIERR